MDNPMLYDPARHEPLQCLVLDEYKNWAAFDALVAKYRAITSKIVGPEEKQVQLMTKRADVREIIGEKVMQELITK